MSDNVEFPSGLIIKAPREGAPDFVKGSISIKREELVNWLNLKQDDWINLDIKVSKQGKWYTQVNTWKPEGIKAAPKEEPTKVIEDDKLDDLPF
ncbi:MAG: hypothetical protein ACI9XC_001827 [Gammaproteobacteria bacterium]|jgi:hypothetical protein